MPIRRLAVLLAVALALSVAVNLFLVGDLAGRASFQAPAAQIGAPGGRLAMVSRYMGLPQADRTRFRAVMAQEGAGLREAQRDVRAAQGGVLAAIRANPYDTQRVLDAFATLRGATTARQVAYQHALAGALGTLTQADRETLTGPVPGAN